MGGRRLRIPKKSARGVLRKLWNFRDYEEAVCLLFENCRNGGGVAKRPCAWYLLNWIDRTATVEVKHGGPQRLFDLQDRKRLDGKWKSLLLVEFHLRLMVNRGGCEQVGNIFSAGVLEGYYYTLDLEV